jgi:hypothetical protein
LVLKKFGEAVWLDLLAKAGIAQDFVENRNYDDEVIYTLLTVASKVCSPPPDQRLLQFRIAYFQIMASCAFLLQASQHAPDSRFTVAAGLACWVPSAYCACLFMTV